MKKPLKSWLVSVFCSLALAAQGPGPEPVDRILAVVNEDPILASDLDQIIGLGLVERGPEEGEQDFRRRVLEMLIEEKLRFQEIDRFGLSEVPLEEVERRFDELRRAHSSDAAFQAYLAELGLDPAALRQLVARQLLVLTYVEERLGPRLFIGLEEIRTYYDEVLVPELRSRGEAAPPIERVREEIRQVLREKRLNEEIGRWTDELRREADIEDYFDSHHPKLPARVLVQEGEGR